MIFSETYTLANGVTIPKLGLGTWMIDDTRVSEVVRQAVIYDVLSINAVESMDLWSISRIVWYAQVVKRCISLPQSMICSANSVAMQEKC